MVAPLLTSFSLRCVHLVFDKVSAGATRHHTTTEMARAHRHCGEGGGGLCSSQRATEFEEGDDEVILATVIYPSPLLH